MTIRDAIMYAQNLNVDYMLARKILLFTLEVEEKYIITNSEEPIEESKFVQYREYIEQLKSGKPIQYITKTQEFMGEKFYVDENVLIPQPDTEVLVEQAILKIQEIIEKKDKATVLDLCTGSGAIAISLKKHFQKNIEIYASDISEKALEVAKKNTKNILKEDINFILSDMFDNINLKFDIIVSNPPYIKTNVIKTLSLDVQREPQIALDGGEDGLKFYRIMRNNIKEYLNNEGYLLMEIGYDQKSQVTNIFENIKCVQDYAKNDRVVIWKNNN